MVEILARIDRDGERLIVVWFPEGFADHVSSVEVLGDLPYWWRTDGRFVDRSEECS